MTPLILLTGFDVFPGLTRNASACLVQRLAARIGAAHPGCSLELDILPVNWTEAPARVQNLISRHRPGLVLMFGVSSRARGFVLERYAFNEASTLADAAGVTGACGPLIASGRARRSSTIPLAQIARDLAAAGLPAEISDDAGRYLCNGVLYHALSAQRAARLPTRTGFIHIPATLEPDQPGAPSLITPEQALEGAQIIVRRCLDSGSALARSEPFVNLERDKTRRGSTRPADRSRTLARAPRT